MKNRFIIYSIYASKCFALICVPWVERERELAHLIVITACLFSHALTRPHYRKVDLFGSLLFGRGSTTERERMCVCVRVFVCV